MEKPFDTISNQPAEVERASPVRVVENPSMPTRPIYHDFISGKDQTEYTPRPPQDAKAVFTESIEYRSGADQKQVQKKRDEQVLSLAKHLFDSKAEELKKFSQCLRIVQSATDKQRAKPTPQLTEAMIVVDRGRPITRKRALERARKEVSGRERPAELSATEDE